MTGDTDIRDHYMIKVMHYLCYITSMKNI